MEKKNEIKEEEVLQEDYEEETLTAEEIADILEEIIPKVEIDLDNVNGSSLDKKQFKNGIESVSYICGQYSALRGVGVDGSSCVDIIVSLLSSEHNIEMQRMTCDNNIEISKIQQVQMEKAQL